MNLFISNIVKNNTAIREERAKRLSKSVEFAQKDLLNSFIKRRMEIEEKRNKNKPAELESKTGQNVKVN